MCFGYIFNECVIIFIWYLIDFSINAPGHLNNVVDGLNARGEIYLKGEMKPIGKLENKNTLNIGMLPVLQNMSLFNFQINVYKLLIIKKY